MSDVGKWLREADPMTAEPGLSTVDRQLMRRATMVAAAERRATPSLWPGPLLVATTVAVTLAAGVVVGRRLPPPRAASTLSPVGGQSTEAVGSRVSARRQLQFATPGGTRVIWVFDPDFKP